MKILFVTSHAYLPQLFGGVQTTTNELCRVLKERNHESAVLCKLQPGGAFSWLVRARIKLNKLLGKPAAVRDGVQGYGVWRSWNPVQHLPYVIACEKPDIVVLVSGEMSDMLDIIKPIGIPVLMMLHNAQFKLKNNQTADFSNIGLLANSHYTSQKFYEAFGVRSQVLYPFIQKEQYATTPERKNVTFINPYPEKGRDIAIEIARRCPEIPFHFITTWTLAADQKAALEKTLSTMPNVTLMPPQTDMRAVYQKCKILLVPSVWEETYGRVITEAQFSAIPAIASNHAGLPESVGAGGIMLDVKGDVEHWVNALKRLWNNEDEYRKLSQLALAHSQRQELNPDYQIQLFEQAAAAAIAATRKS